MRGYKKSLSSVAQILSALEKSGRLVAGERLLINRLLKKLTRAIARKDEKALRKTIDEICQVFIRKVRG